MKKKLGEEKMKTREDKRMVKLDFISIFLKTSFFEHMLAHSLFGAWSFLLIHIRFKPSEGPKGFVILFYFKIGP